MFLNLFKKEPSCLTWFCFHTAFVFSNFFELHLLIISVLPKSACGNGRGIGISGPGGEVVLLAVSFYSL